MEEPTIKVKIEAPGLSAMVIEEIPMTQEQIRLCGLITQLTRDLHDTRLDLRNSIKRMIKVGV